MVGMAGGGGWDAHEPPGWLWVRCAPPGCLAGGAPWLLPKGPPRPGGSPFQKVLTSPGPASSLASIKISSSWAAPSMPSWLSTPSSGPASSTWPNLGATVLWGVFLIPGLAL